MQLSAFVESNKDAIIEQWQQFAVARLSLGPDLEKSQLLNDLPEFIDEVVRALHSRENEWPHIKSARDHGKQRMRIGVDVGSLVEEMTMVGDAIAELATEQGTEFENDDLLRMMSIIGRGAAASVRAYAALRDRELADQAAQHFSFIAHEIRNPLHSARLSAETLAVVPEERRQVQLERLEQALLQLAELVDDSLLEARLYGDPHLDVQAIGSRMLIEQIYEDLESQIVRRRLKAELAAEDFTLDADRTLLYSALSNLLSNAIKFTPEGGRIAVRARSMDGRAVFTVDDQCGGIPDDIEQRLFEPFVQAQTSKGGSGLGLLIVKQAIEAHDGHVQVENNPGVGCCFTVNLPQKQEARE
ncbi:MAG: HAMP domain-containing sensor histidine kinase [Woeseia sp.]